MVAKLKLVKTSDPVEAGFSALRDQLLTYMSVAEVSQVEQAFLYAKAAHHNQFRKSGEPYITHPVAAALILAELQLDQHSIMAALLHDVIEDTRVEKQDLIQRFGKDVANLVDGVSKLTKIEFATRVEAAAENFCKMIMATGRDLRVIIVKLADRLHNMRTISALSVEKRRHIGLETLEIYALIAHRLGIYKFYAEFEDLGFAAVYPFRHHIIEGYVNKTNKAQSSLRHDLLKAIQHQFKKLHVPVVEITWRKRHYYSYYKKMREEQRSLPEILDRLLLRIVVNDLPACYQVLGVLHNQFMPITEQFKDYIAIPKANGYQSLHTTLLITLHKQKAIPLEVQIRTQEMDRLANFGVVAHWQNSLSGKTDDAHLRAQSWLNDLLEMHKTLDTSEEFVDAVKTDLFPDEVYVFTPNGKILALPKDACPVDFAYMIHSDIGNTCVAAKVDRRLVPLSTPLTSGQTIEIITAAGARPNPAWLNFVTTAKARSNIRQFLKMQQHLDTVRLGEQLLKQALATLGQRLMNISSQRFNQIIGELQLSSREDLYETIGQGNEISLLIAKRLLGDVGTAPQSEEQPPALPQPLAIQGSAGLAIHFAECCYPIPGDPIVAVVRPGQGVSIHGEHCQELMAHPALLQQSIPAAWENKVSGYFKVEVELEVTNQPGTLARVATTISDSEANIEDIAMTERLEQCSRLHLLILVKDRNHLARILKRIRNLKAVLKVFRKR